VLHRLAEPAVIRRVRVSARELIVDDIITRVDLAMSLALVLIPDPPALSGKYGSDGQQPCYLPGFEDPALRIDEGNGLPSALLALVLRNGPIARHHGPLSPDSDI
jgi:hypothetical protein